MAVSGWFVLLLAAGAVPVVLTGGPVGLLGWLALCVVALVVDLALACACADGDATALRHFDRSVLPAAWVRLPVTDSTPPSA